VDELVAAAEAYDAGEAEGDVAQFLEQVALVTDVDRWKEQEDRVTLMTLHMAKGLEFPVVFIAGMEDGLLPFIRRGGSWWEDPDIDPEQLEEERRLCFVGITRAKELVVLTHTEEGSGRNWDSFAEPSRFLDELPQDAIRVHNVPGRRSRSVVKVEPARKPRKKMARHRKKQKKSPRRR
jgi:DNA helicase-2/ATP-dependent DNA helicase PcrA